MKDSSGFACVASVRLTRIEILYSFYNWPSFYGLLIVIGIDSTCSVLFIYTGTSSTEPVFETNFALVTFGDT